MLITIIVPIFNEENTIIELLEKVNKQKKEKEQQKKRTKHKKEKCTKIKNKRKQKMKNKEKRKEKENHKHLRWSFNKENYRCIKAHLFCFLCFFWHPHNI